MSIKFCIITSTFNRPDLLIRCVNSVQNTNYNNFTHIIINDSPECDYSLFEKKYLTKYKNIIYIKNSHNSGANRSRNIGIEMLETNTFAIFLDDDDVLLPDTLNNLNNYLSENKDTKWLVSQKSFLNKDVVITINNTNKNKIDYLWDYLIFKKFIGDAMHCINSNVLLNNQNIRFPVFIKNGEEWIFFVNLYDKLESFIFIKLITFMGDYQEIGLTNNLKNEYFKRTIVIIRNIKYFYINLRLTNFLKVILYMLLRIVNSIRTKN